MEKIIQGTLILFLTALVTITISIPAAIAQADWNLKVIDTSGKTQTLTYQNLKELPQTTVSSVLECYGSLVAYGNWTGPKVSDVLNYAAINQSSGSLLFLASDGYSTAISVETALRPDVIIAYSMDDEPLAENLRLVVPGANGNVWIAGITSINMTTVQVSNVQSENLYVPSLHESIVSTYIQGQPVLQQPQNTPKPTLTPAIPSPSPGTKPASPVNISEPTQEPFAQPDSGAESLRFSDVAFVFVLGAIVAVLAGGAVVFWRKKG